MFQRNHAHQDRAVRLRERGHVCFSFLYEECKGPVGLVREAWREKTNPSVVGVAQKAHSRRRAEQRGGVKAQRRL